MNFRFLPIALSALLAGCTTATQSQKKFSVATAATNQLGLELYRQLAASNPGENIILSPLSIQSALAVAYAGADGETRTEMASVLHFPADDATLAASLESLQDALGEAVKKAHGAKDGYADIYRRQKESIQKQLQELMAKGEAVPPAWDGILPFLDELIKDFDSQSTALRMANGIFGQTGYEYREPFLNFVRDRYGSPLQQFNFAADANAARLGINAWVASQTENQIRDALPAGSVNANTRLVLLNALYFKAYWNIPFVKEYTYDLPFQVRGTQMADVPIMRQTAIMGYTRRNGYTVVALPYLGGDLQFLILLPDDPTGVDALAAKITPKLLGDFAKLNPRKVNLLFPRFNIEPPALALANMLQAIGLKTVFDLPPGSANFDRIAAHQPDHYLALNDILHKTSLLLDEYGTVATASSVGQVVSIGIEEREAVVVVDHPFLFAIQHRDSGACLFLGRVTDPR